MRHTFPDTVKPGGQTAPLGAVGGTGEGSDEADPRRAVLEAFSLEKRFGERRALDPVSFSVYPGDALIVIGANGSGKTTLLRLLAGLAAPTAGRLTAALVRAQVGYLGHESLLYRELTATENLDLLGQLYRVPERHKRITSLLERYGLSRVRDERVGSFSRGMVQRVALCRALLHEPSLLVLDEPHTALDDEGAAMLDAELHELAGRVTLVVATHDPERLAPVASGELRLGVA